jgi:EAL domain-containing protein (putative c-di-GMP-specific phosphodiesterase class I)
VSPAPSSLAPGGNPLRLLAQELDALRPLFAERGALAVVAVETGALAAVEERFGTQAHRQVVGRLADRLREMLEGELGPDDRVMLGEVGAEDLLLVLPRERKDQAFYVQVLPRLVRRIAATVAELSSRVAYPFVRTRLPLPVGSAVAFYDPTRRPETLLRRVREQALEEARLAAHLAVCARRDALVALLFSERVGIAFEPIVGLGRGQTLGFEALVRGEPGSDLATPAELFAAAHEAELLFEMDCLCRRAALREAKRLPAGAKLFLNCLPSAIHDPAFEGEALRRTLQDHRLTPSDVVLEISERESIGSFDIFREACDHYASLGFRIALDDVGVGYGSLEAVTELRPSFIKVDIAFVRGIDADPARQEVLVAMNSIARRIGAEIIAEGIETQEQLETLRRLAIPWGQGHLLGAGGRAEEAR